jgi:hypothetical protein
MVDANLSSNNLSEQGAAPSVGADATSLAVVDAPTGVAGLSLGVVGVEGASSVPTRASSVGCGLKVGNFIHKKI